MVIVDRLSKQCIFAEALDVQGAYLLSLDVLFSKHGVPYRRVSDRYPKFKSHYWRGLVELTNVSLNM